MFKASRAGVPPIRTVPAGFPGFLLLSRKMTMSVRERLFSPLPGADVGKTSLSSLPFPRPGTSIPKAWFSCSQSLGPLFPSLWLRTDNTPFSCLGDCHGCAECLHTAGDGTTSRACGMQSGNDRQKPWAAVGSVFP